MTEERTPYRYRWVAAGLALVLVISAAVALVWPGYDQAVTPKDSISVWALQTGEGRRYGRVNTALAEIDTVQGVKNPSAVAQVGDVAVVFSEGYQTVTVVNNASPEDLSADGAVETSVPTPPETRSVTQAGDYLLYRTANGELFTARIETPGSFEPVLQAPSGQSGQSEDKPDPLLATAATISPAGEVAAYVAATRQIWTAHAGAGYAQTNVTLGDGTTPFSANAEDLQMAWAGSQWALFDSTNQTLWVSGLSTPVSLGTVGEARLQQSTTKLPGDDIYLADSEGLLVISGTDGTVTRTVTVAAGATAAAPAALGTEVFAAWVYPGPQVGVLWSSETGESTLTYANGTLPETLDLRFVSNGSQMILNEIQSGWVWLAPSGSLVASSQQWDVDELTVVEAQDVETQQVLDPRPPVAEPDAFGVRAGQETLLPVLLNDHDPNQDVLSIVPESVTALDTAFGTVKVADNQQQLVVNVSAGATGSASFTYQVTDGSSANGLTSAPATVTLTVADDATNSDPVWCGVTDCLAKWPRPTVAPGGTVETQVLGGWVDPEGDALFVSEVTSQVDVGTVVGRPDGTVTYQHPDPNLQEALTVPVEVTVSNSRGASASKVLNITVTPQPTVEFAPMIATGVTGTPMQVDVSSQLTGVTGRPRLTAVTEVTESATSINTNADGLSFTFSSSQPGSYPLQVTVSDENTEVTGTVRVILQDPEQVQISTVPLTVFLRPNEDTTVDVLSAVTNPAGSVLLVDDLIPVAADEASLNMKVVGQESLHVTGTTADGQPGLLGTATYRVSDGTGSVGGTASGQVTVMLLSEAPDQRPIASDDWASVPAGAQVDVPVLANDVAPLGAQIAIDPSTVVNIQDAGLAFATPTRLRYLAPEEPGEYTVTYSVYRLGYPSLTDSATVHITVVEDSSDAQPRPAELHARVLNGAAVTIPFTSSAVGLPGEMLRLERVITQPKYGSAVISPEGDSIIYRANPGASGQDTFTYQVRSRSGTIGTGTVRVGILDGAADPSPLAYSDYVQIQVGEGSEVVVLPLANDVDPAGGALELVDVVPNAPEYSEEYAQLNRRLLGFDTETGEVRIAAGDILGTSSFQYTVTNEYGDTAVGLIITKVVREPVPDFPLVQDTRLNSETLPNLPTGVNVLDGKVSWTSGAVSDLDLSLWKPETGFSVSGWQISGPIPDTSRIIPFQVTGTSFQGETMTTYAFLRVPTQTEIPLALKASAGELQVDEGASASMDLAQVVAHPPGERLQFDATLVHASGTRPQAACTLSGTTLRYDAGQGSPWQDSCSFGVRVAGQEDFTILSIPVRIIPDDPQPQLRAAALEISPGQTRTYDLTQMVQWEGPPDYSQLRYAISGGGQLFQVSQLGAQLTITGKDASKPGRQETLMVSLPSHPDAAAAPLTMTVGPAPSLLPRGGTVTQTCSQVGGQTSCVIPVMGQPGETNPLPGTPLKLVSVGATSSCPGVTFALEGSTSVRATWGANTPGAAACIGRFTVQDAQGTLSAGDGDGTVIVDLNGLPAAPTRIEWVGYTGDSVRLQVVSDSSSYPALTGYRLVGAGNGSCSLDGNCQISGLSNGQAETFQVFAVNSVGESRTAASISAYAYEAPRAPSSGSFVPVAGGDRGGKVRLSITGIDPSTEKLMVSGGDAAETIPVTSTSAEFAYQVGTNTGTTLTITPVSRFTPPPVGNGSTSGAALTLAGVHGIGAPEISLNVGTTDDPEVLRASVEVTNGNGMPTGRTLIGVSTAGTCQPTQAASSHTWQLPVRQAETVIVTACALNQTDGEVFGTAEKSETPPRVPIVAPGQFTYSVDDLSVTSGRSNNVYTWSSVSSNVTSTRFTVQYATNTAGTGLTTNLSSLFPLGQAISVYPYFCEGTFCSPAGPKLTATGPVPATVRISFPEDAAVCPAADDRKVTVVGFAHSGLPDDVSERDGREIWTVNSPWGRPIQWSCALSPPPDPTPEPTPEPPPGGEGDEGGNPDGG